MTEIERQIFRIEGDIYVLNMHLKNEQNPTKYDLPKPSDERQHCIAGLKTKIAGKQIEIKQLKRDLTHVTNKNTKPRSH